MTFFNRAAGIVAMALGITGMIGASTPGFALELDKSVNVPALLPVPKPVATPAVVVTPVPADTTRTDTPDPSAQTEGDDSTPEYASLSDAVAAQGEGAVDTPVVVHPAPVAAKRRRRAPDAP